MVTSDFRTEVEIWPFRACAMHLATIIGTVRSLWTWLRGRYHVPQNAFLVLYIFCLLSVCLFISVCFHCLPKMVKKDEYSRYM